MLMNTTLERTIGTNSWSFATDAHTGLMHASVSCTCARVYIYICICACTYMQGDKAVMDSGAVLVDG